MPSFTVLSGPHAGETIAFGRRTEAPLFRGVVLTRSPAQDDADAPFVVLKTSPPGGCALDGIEKKLGTLPRFVTCNAVSLPLDSAISEQHAVVVDAGDGRFFCADLSSTNGTRLNGRQLESWQQLKSGTRISCGESELLWSGELSPLRRRKGSRGDARTRARWGEEQEEEEEKEKDKQKGGAEDGEQQRGEAPPPLSPYLTRRKASFLSAMTGRKKRRQGRGNGAGPGSTTGARVGGSSLGLGLGLGPGSDGDALLLRDRIGLEVQIAEKINRRARALDGIDAHASDAAATAAVDAAALATAAAAAAALAAAASPILPAAASPSTPGGGGVDDDVDEEDGNCGDGDRGNGEDDDAGDKSEGRRAKATRRREQHRRQQRKKLRKAAAGIFASPVRVPFRKTRVAVASGTKVGDWGRGEDRDEEGELSMGALAMDLGDCLGQAARDGDDRTGGKSMAAPVALPSPFFERGSVPAWAQAQREQQENKEAATAVMPRRPLLLFLVLIVSVAWG